MAFKEPSVAFREHSVAFRENSAAFRENLVVSREHSVRVERTPVSLHPNCTQEALKKSTKVDAEYNLLT